MLHYLIRRIAQIPLLLAGIIVFNFLLIHTAPGDPIVALAGEYGNAAYYDEMRTKFGLDRPLPEQLGVYVYNLVRGDLGHSYTYGQPVMHVILDRTPTTLLLVGVALVLSTIFGIGMGLVAARWPHTGVDTAVTVALLAGYALPVFWLAQMMIFFLALNGGWFPVQGMTNAREQLTGWPYVVDVAHHLALPAMALAVQQMALVGRLTRSEMVDLLGQPFILAARARGLPQRLVLMSHALRNALLPIVTVIGGRLGFLLAGAVLTETVFAWPGLGRLLLDATQARDYPILMGMLLLTSVMVIVANLLTDIVYAWLDPRITFT